MVERLTLKTKKVQIPLKQLLAVDQFAVVDFRVTYAYVNGERTDKPSGVRYTVVEMRSVNRFDVFTPTATPVVTEEMIEDAANAGGHVYVRLTNAVAKPYQAGYGEIEFSVSADSVEIVSNK